MSTNDIRAEARAQAKYPYVKPEIVDDMIDRAEYWRVPDTTTIICCIVLKNGFTVEDCSSCIDPRNFNEDLGKRLAYSKARDKVFHFLAFACMDEAHVIAGA